MFRTALIATAALGILAAASQADAADLGARPMYTKAPMAPVSNWTGFYGAIGGGYGMSDTNNQSLAGAALLPFGATVDAGGKGAFGTVQLGADYQFMPSWLFGVFADYDFSNIKGNMANSIGLVGPMDQKSAWAVGGRLGYLVTPQLLTYFDGGYSQARFNGGEQLTTGGGAPFGVSSQNQTYSGYFIGSGTEYMFAPGWSIKGEYRYAEYERKTNVFTTDATGAPAGFANNAKPVVQTVRTSLVYKFWGR